MYFIENPVLQWELLANLRRKRAFLLLLVYQAALALVVYMAWPQDAKLDLTGNPESARTLGDLFFLGQYVIASLIAPSFAAGAITGEKERQTYEMLLASPLRPAAIVLGKLVASLAHLAVLIFASLPIVMLCLPLGGIHPYEVVAAYIGIISSVITFGMISIACSSAFQRTSASLVVSYLIILPLVMIGASIWYVLADHFAARILLAALVMPAIGAAVCALLFASTAARLLHPPDVGSEGKDVVDLERESQQAVGLVIQRDQFPDWLFAPAKREDLMEDNANPVYDKEMRSEIFSQGTLMLRVVIQVSMALCLPLMAVCLYIMPQFSAWYISYVIVFNMLVGPVFSAGSVTSERERETLDLLLTTVITPWQILWGKLFAGLRVSCVLTLFLLWPLLLACIMVSAYWVNLLAVGAYLLIVLVTCLTTAMVALFCSVLFKKTSHALLATYLALAIQFCAPLAMSGFAMTFFPTHPSTVVIAMSNVVSPLGATISVPLNIDTGEERFDSLGQPIVRPTSWVPLGLFIAATSAENLTLLGAMIWLFNTRWRVAG
ncbi:MAG TPA: ABC transporter permease subunit [Pirellulaceae bacterium]|nr:ABC transporter permease subunit [Pirellulaceae bacterium]